MNDFALISCFFVILGAALANPTVREDESMVYVGMMDGFIVLDEDTMSNNSHPKLPEVIKGNHSSKVPELITGSPPKLPEEVIGSGQKLTESPIKPTTIKLPQLAFVSPPPSGRPYYLYGPHPYLFQTAGYGYNPSYVSQANYGARPYAPQTGYGINPYVSQIDYSNEFRPRPTYSRPLNPSYGFRPYAGEVDQDALFQYTNID